MKMRSSVVDEVEFYESLDRILSSSCSSTSASDDEADHRHRHRFPPPSPAAVAAAYEVWIAEPGPVEERRRRLLQMMGLTGDKALSRGKPPIAIVNSGEIPLSVSYKEVYRRMDHFSSSILFARSRSDGDVDSSAGNRQLLVPPRSPVVIDGGDDPRCTITNLDTGREFVVKEFRDDGMWKKLREIGTGRQLTMEEFEMCMGRSPIVQELMRRQSVHYCGASAGGQISGDGMEMRLKKRRSWLKSITNMAGIAVQQFDKRSSDERDSSSERGRRSSSATDDCQDGSDHLFHGAERIRARRYGKSYKELSGLYMTQDIQAHTGSIWRIRFSLDGRYLASAGEDCVIHVWQALERKRKGCLEMEGATGENGNGNGDITAFSNGTPEVAFALACMEANHLEKQRRPKISSGRKSLSLDNIIVPELFFALEEKPLRSFKGHLDDVLDLCWSKSQFNPVDDRYFISGSLDKKIRIWSIPDRRVVDWNDLQEMVTAACYTPDGKGALVGSHKGSCYLYDTTDNKLHQKTQIDLQNKKKKSSHKKITGFQFAPGSNSEVFVTSADSRIRVVNGVQLVHKLKGFRNTNSQISASLTANGNYAVCASEDSHVYVWSHCFDPQPRPKCNGSKNITQSYEHFQCRDVTAAIPWPNTCNLTPGSTPPGRNQNSYGAIDSPGQAIPNSSAANLFGDRASATWPEEELVVSSTSSSPRSGTDLKNGGIHLLRNSAWGMVIVTAGRGGQIRTFQNFGFPVKS
ncbi:hypothetical protein KFK09_010568 [Dendrobium nobile]|uniref:Uncharacterized protein n=1 Tax=Dendrobium nobile TaxID=94219 RepID=A0A8T3BFZ5_DENNO|nr:hypothetical protein KFK09_010568 [Dendrobium nobile]